MSPTLNEVGLLAPAARDLEALDLATDLLAGARLAGALLAGALLAGARLARGFLAAGFLAAGFLAAGFWAVRDAGIWSAGSADRSSTVLVTAGSVTTEGLAELLWESWEGCLAGVSIIEIEFTGS